MASDPPYPIDQPYPIAAAQAEEVLVAPLEPAVQLKPADQPTAATDSTDDDRYPGDVQQPTMLTLPAQIGWREGLRAGWTAEPRMQFYGREVLLGALTGLTPSAASQREPYQSYPARKGRPVATSSQHHTTV